MCTETTSCKIHAGPHLRAAIDNLPPTGHTHLSGEQLTGKSPGHVLFRVWDELSDVAPRLTLIEAAHEVGEREEWPDHAANGIRDSVERARSLICAIRFDLEGRPLAEVKS